MSVNSESVFDVRFAKQRSNDIGKWLRVILHGSYRLQNVCCSYVGQKLVNDVFRIYFAFKEEMGKKNHVSFWKLVRYIYMLFILHPAPTKEDWMGKISCILLKTRTIHISFILPSKEDWMVKNHVSFWQTLWCISHLFCRERRRNGEKIMYHFDKPYATYVIYFSPPKKTEWGKIMYPFEKPLRYICHWFFLQSRRNGVKIKYAFENS